MACCSRGLEQPCRRYRLEVEDALHMHKLIICMQKVALQAGRMEDPGDVAWRDLERLLQIAGTSTSTQLMRTTDFFVRYGLSRFESVDPWGRYTGKRLWGRILVDCLKAPTGYDLSCCCRMHFLHGTETLARHFVMSHEFGSTLRAQRLAKLGSRQVRQTRHYLPGMQTSRVFSMSNV